MTSERLKGNLDLLLLATLRRGPAHGYAIITALAASSAGAFDLPEGTVYPALHRLEDRGLVVSDWQVVGGRRRRVYALTRSGRRACAAETSAWRGFQAGVTAVLGPA